MAIPLSVREKIVDRIVAERAKTNFGLSELQVVYLMESLKKEYRLNIDLAKLPQVWKGN